jgi:glycosyltransferase involved in cell wall biosynthesis
MDISVVIPTCNRPERLLSLLRNLRQTTQPVREVLVVDSSDRPLPADALEEFAGLGIVHMPSPRSVCVQRNAGIRAARAPWIFLCDDDVEVPPDYLARLSAHLTAHPACGAVSGLFLEKQGERWSAEFTEPSARVIVWKYLFGMGLWGEIRDDGAITRWIAKRYRRRGNHIARSGWPVITDMKGPFFRTPIYSLGASLIRRDWLVASPFDETLDSHGMGDNYGVAIGFPPEGIHVLTGARVFHHRAPANRLGDGVAQERRMLALAYFIRSRPELEGVSVAHFIWSLVGGGILHGLSGNHAVSLSTWRALRRVILDLGLDLGRIRAPERRAAPTDPDTTSETRA